MRRLRAPSGRLGRLRLRLSSLSREVAQVAFDEYAGAFDMGDARVVLKYEHTMRVAGLCEEIAVELGMTSDEVDPAWLCGLLHDIGRFEQLQIWGTFNDSVSCGHARMGLAVLDGEPEFGRHGLSDADGRLCRFAGEEVADVVRPAVTLHSCLRLPDEFDSWTRRYCEIVRDADKVDILRVFGSSDVHDVLGLKADEFLGGEISDAAMAGFREGRCLGPGDRCANLDGLVGVICLPFELVYEPSRLVLDRLGYLRVLIERPFGMEPTFFREDTAVKWAAIRKTVLHGN